MENTRNDLKGIKAGIHSYLLDSAKDNMLKAYQAHLDNKDKSTIQNYLYGMENDLVMFDDECRTQTSLMDICGDDIEAAQWVMSETGQDV